MRGTTRRGALRDLLSTLVKRSAVTAFAVAIVLLVTGTGVAAADTHTGFVLTVTCGTATTTVVSPTGQAAAGQDVSSHGVLILAVGEILAPSSFPAGKVEFCNVDNLTTGDTFTDVPFLIPGAP